MSILSLIKGLFAPAESFIDSITTTREEKDQAKFLLEQLQNTVITQMTELEKEKIKAQSSIIIAEASGDSWLQRNWRPITMLTFLVIIVFNLVLAPVFGLVVPALPGQMWPLLTLGIGGYVAARSVDKNLPSYFKAKYGEIE